MKVMVFCVGVIRDPERRPKMGWFYMVVCMGHHTNYP